MRLENVTELLSAATSPEHAADIISLLFSTKWVHNSSSLLD